MVRANDKKQKQQKQRKKNMAHELSKYNEIVERDADVTILKEWGGYARLEGFPKNIKAIAPDSWSGLEGKTIRVKLFIGRVYNEKKCVFDEVGECLFLSDIGQPIDQLADGTELEIMPDVLEVGEANQTHEIEAPVMAKNRKRSGR